MLNQGKEVGGMFGKKKKDMAPHEEEFKCSVPGCGLSCLNRDSLERHMEWAHPGVAASQQEKGTPPLQTNKV